MGDQVSRENHQRDPGPVVERGASAPARHGAAVLSATAVLLLIAAPASASEGDLVLTPDLPMLLALMAFFIALIFPVNALLFRPIFAVLDAREDKIAGTRARAEKLVAEAEKVLQRYQASVRETREAAEQERRNELASAKSVASEQLTDARGDAERQIAQARREIQSALGSARASLRGDAEALAREAGTRILGRNVS
jgi:F-type H+-transporting ATPase subunit b